VSPRAISFAACALVLGIFGWAAHSGVLESVSPSAADTYYNLLAQGFRAGHVSLEKDVPLGLAALGDPYDPAANALYRSARYRLHDLSYYRGRLYLYFGVTPVLVLFWPFAALSGHYLYHRQAAAVFCALGFLAAAWLLHVLRRRYFSGIGAGVMAACALALGLASGLPLLLSRAEVYEVAIGCGYMLAILGLAAMAACLHATGWKRLAWLAATSLACGLAVGARPSLLPGVLILLLPVFTGCGELAPGARPSRPALKLILAGLVPFACCGAGLALYNYERFGRISEFGQRYQLAGISGRDLAEHFSPRYFWFNVRVYFLAPVHWIRSFPFVGGIAVPPLPVGHRQVEDPFGVLANVPIVWFALAAPLAWWGRPADERAKLRWLAVALAWLAGSAILVVCLLDGSCSRYEVDFLPELIFLAVLGILGLERALAGRPGMRRGVRVIWGLLLGVSVAFNLLAAVEHYAEARCDTGIVLMQEDRMPEAVQAYRDALRVKPDYVDAHTNLGVALSRLGRLPEAMEQYEDSLRLVPGNTPARIDLGNALAQSNRWTEAIGQYERALQLDPGNADVHYNLALVLQSVGRTDEARAQRAEAARLESRR